MRSLEVIGRLVCAHLHTHSKKITKPRKSKKKKGEKTVDVLPFLWVGKEVELQKILAFWLSI